MTPTVSEASCLTKLLPDLPAEQDEFGPHDRIAQAIATLLLEEQGGKAVALTGSWGSGKSTVVKLLQANLIHGIKEGKSAVEVFVFDTWAHQGDPLRRSFLESLVNFLVERRWTDKKRWEGELEKISQRKEETSTTSQPILTLPGRLIATCALLLPLGYTLFGKFDSDLTFFGLRAWHIGLIGLSISLLPLLVALVTWLFWRPTWRFWQSNFWRDHRAPHQGESIVGFFIQKTREVVRSKTIKTADPTSLEFQEIFAQIVGDTLKDPNRKLVVVIDNLDRVDPSDAISVWATMRAFFELDSRRNHAWITRFWLLVPFDPPSLQRLWEAEADGGAELADAFVKKTFQADFRVSPPVLSDWKQFFYRQLGIAFPTHSQQQDFHTVYRLFSLLGLPQKRPLTPRDIKLFINKVGALHRQWGDEIPLPSQALYVLCTDKIKDAGQSLIQPDFLDPKARNVVGELEWQKHLAALHFNVRPEKAAQVLVGRQIELALSQGDAQKLQDVRNVPGFLAVCEQIVEQNRKDWARDEPGALATAALILQGIESTSEPSWTWIWHWLRTGVFEVGQWKALNEQVGRGIVAIWRTAEQEQERAGLAQKILESLSKTPIEGQDKQVDDEKLSHWVSGVLQVVTAFHEESLTELLGKTFGVPGTTAYIAILVALAERQTAQDLIRYFIPKVGPGAIVDELTKICKEGRLREEHAKAIELMGKMKKQWPWSELITTLTQRLQGNNNLQSVEVLGCVRALVVLSELYGIQEAGSALQQLTTQGYITHHLHQASSANDPNTVAMCMVPITKFTPRGDPQNNVWSSSHGAQKYQDLLSRPQAKEYAGIVEVFSDHLAEFQKVEAFIETAKSSSQLAGLGSAVLGMLAKREKANEYLPSRLVIAYYSYLADRLDEATLDHHVTQLVSQADLLASLGSQTFSRDLAGLYLQAYKASQAEQRASFTRFLVAGVQAISDDVWVEELKQERVLLELLFELIEGGVSVALSANFEDALLSHAMSVLGGQGLPSTFQGGWSQLLSALKPESKETFLRNLRDELLRSDKVSIKPVVSLYGDDLIGSNALADELKSDEMVRVLFKGVVDRRDLTELTWLSRFLKRRPGILTKCEKASKGTLTDRVVGALKNKEFNEQTQIPIREIAEMLGIDPNEADFRNHST